MKRKKVISVWIIEDDDDDRNLIAEAFGESLLQVIILPFPSATEAIVFLQNCRPAELPRIIVTDFNMPRMNGFEFINHLQKDTKYKEIKKIVLSTACLPADQQKCIDNGADAYIKKPFTYGELVSVTGGILSLLRAKTSH
jgi:CheY-like chemotaxis protein